MYRQNHESMIKRKNGKYIVKSFKKFILNLLCEKINRKATSFKILEQTVQPLSLLRNYLQTIKRKKNKRNLHF